MLYPLPISTNLAKTSFHPSHPSYSVPSTFASAFAFASAFSISHFQTLALPHLYYIVTPAAHVSHGYPFGFSRHLKTLFQQPDL